MTRKVKLTEFENGSILIEPYASGSSCRYGYLLHTENAELRTTQQDYICLFRFPRKNGILAAARNLVSECGRLAILMTNLYYHHNEK